MPFVTVRLIEGQSPEKKDEVARRISAAVNEVFGTPNEAIWITYEDVKAAEWYSAGTSVQKHREAKG